MTRKHYLGLRSLIYAVTDLNQAKAWYSEVLGYGPYFDEPFYVGFNVGGFELGLLPSGQPIQAGTAVCYWGVEHIDKQFARLLKLGATEHNPIQDVGGGIRAGAVLDPFGNVFGLIYNPEFEVES